MLFVCSKNEVTCQLKNVFHLFFIFERILGVQITSLNSVMVQPKSVIQIFLCTVIRIQNITTCVIINFKILCNNLWLRLNIR